MEATTGADLLLFDLDGTLYDDSCGYGSRVHSQIFDFMVETTGGKFDAVTTSDDARTAWAPIFEKYNLTKRGLVAEGYVFDGDAYDTYVRRGASEHISADRELRVLLQSLPQRKAIFTNAPEASARTILGLLGVADLFEIVLGTGFMGDTVCKPERGAFLSVLERLGVGPAEYSRVCFFEDSYKNLCAGKELGFRTVFVRPPTPADGGRGGGDLAQFDAVLERKVGPELQKLMPDLWDAPRDVPAR